MPHQTRPQLRWPESVGHAWSAVPRRPAVEVIAQALTEYGPRPVITFEDGAAISGTEMLSAVDRFASWLDERIDVGDRVIIAIGNRAEFFIAYLAVLAARAVAVKISPEIGPRDAEHILTDSGAKLVICEHNSAQIFSDLGSAEVLALTEGSEPDGLQNWYGSSGRVDLFDTGTDVDEPAGITYTSGTTGPPKGCVHDHLQYLRYADVNMRVLRLNPDDVILNPLQFYYGDSIWLWVIALRLQAQYISVRKFSVSRFWLNVTRHRVTVFLGIGAIPNLLLSAPASDRERDHGIRLALQVGIPPAQHHRLVERFGHPWIEGYGMSECGAVLSMPIDIWQDYIGTGAIGIPLPEVAVQVRDSTHAVLHGPATGGLYVRTPDMMIGYFNRHEATLEVLDVDEWLDTGDLVRRDGDGMYYFVGRSKLIIRRGGENIAPEEVEAVLRQHPSVIDAAVVPVADELRGEEIKAYVEMADGYSFDPSKLAAFCASQLSVFKVPRYIEQRIGPFPRTPSMRIQKSLLTEIDGNHSVSQAWDGAAVPT